MRIQPITNKIHFTRRPEEMNRKYPQPTFPNNKDRLIKTKK